jgi:hypothetical protein
VPFHHAKAVIGPDSIGGCCRVVFVHHDNDAIDPAAMGCAGDACNSKLSGAAEARTAANFFSSRGPRIVAISLLIS